ncbi:Acetylcholine receptor subunit alpha-L1 [Mizuhopecten yessoensis]|uniref:Acetylcholine receptor subunit alpha-L1 n=1 Tax=Mizuhopecten yessoensis TaxID=6573 RepID=A0A210R5B4_MIZYE|nr:Acetylcholine receptor subunit alpha-L1 [Mizuhopecten yessoensis]
MLVHTFVTFSVLSFVSANFRSDSKRLYEDLAPAFETAHFRPVLNESDSVQVKVDLYLVGIYSFDVRAQVLRSNVYWMITWMNLSFRWRPDRYGGIQSVNVPVQSIWSPDLIIGNGIGETKKLRIDSQVEKMELFSDGKQVWWPGRDTETSCSFDISNYPFDSQICEIGLEKWYLNDSKQSLESVGNNINTDMFKKNGEWELSGTNVTKTVLLFEGHSYTRLHFTIYLTRRWQRKCLSIILPVVILSFINCFCFYLPVDSGEKTGLAVAIFLTFIFLLSGLSNSIPHSSVKMSVFEVYINVQLTLSGLTVILTVIILSVYNTPCRNTYHVVWWQTVLLWIFKKVQPKHLDINPSDNDANNQQYGDNKMRMNKEFTDAVRLDARLGLYSNDSTDTTNARMYKSRDLNCVHGSKTKTTLTPFAPSGVHNGHEQDQTDMVVDRNVWQETAVNLDKFLFVKRLLFDAILVFGIDGNAV